MSWWEDHEEVECRSRSSVSVETCSGPSSRPNSVHEAWRLALARLCSGGMTDDSGEVDVVGSAGRDIDPR